MPRRPALIQLHSALPWPAHACPALSLPLLLLSEKKTKDYAFWRQLDEKPSTTPRCPALAFTCLAMSCCCVLDSALPCFAVP